MDLPMIFLKGWHPKSLYPLIDGTRVVVRKGNKETLEAHFSIGPKGRFK